MSLNVMKVHTVVDVLLAVSLWWLLPLNLTAQATLGMHQPFLVWFEASIMCMGPMDLA